MKKKEILTDEEPKKEVMKLTSKILKILYIVIIITIISLIVAICKQLDVFPFLLKLLSVISPLFIGFIIAWLFSPVVSWLNKKGISRILASIIVYIVLMIIIYLFLRMLIPTVYEQVNDLIKVVPTVFTEVKDFIVNLAGKFKNIEGINVVSIENNMIGYLESFATSITTNLPNSLLTILSSIASGIGTFLVSLIIGFYMLFNFDNTSEHMLSLIPKKYRYELRTLTAEISSQLRRYVNGVLLCAGIICITTTLGFAVIGLKAPLLFGLFCGVTNIIPYVGPYIGGAPAVLVGFSQSPTIGILVLVILVIIQTIEGNLLSPVIMSKTMKLHPVTIIIGLLVFGAFFGIWGMILATPIIAFLKIIVTFFISKYDLFDYDNEPTELIDLGPIKKKSKK